MINLFHHGLKGWMYMSDADRMIADLVANGLEMPAHLSEVAQHWHSGQSSMLYAVASTGAVKRGSVRPQGDERPMTDAEWMLSLLDEAANEFRDAACHAEGGEDEQLLIEAAEFIEPRADALRRIVEL